MNTVDDHGTFLFVSGVVDGILLLENEHTWLIIIQNCHSSAGIFTDESGSSLRIVDLNIEILIRLPAIVINDFDGDFGLSHSLREGDFFINSCVIVFSNSITINSSDPDGSCLFALVDNLNSQGTGSFTDRVVEAGETEVGVLLVVAQLFCGLVLASDGCTLRDSFLSLADTDGLTVGDSLDKGGAFELCLKLVFVNFGDLGGSEVKEKEFLHLSGHFFLTGSDFLTSLNREKDVVEILDIHVKSHLFLFLGTTELSHF